MPKRRSCSGDFAAQNSGKISNCYSVVRLRTKKGTVSRFVGENSGIIEDSHSYSPRDYNPEKLLQFKREDWLHKPLTAFSGQVTKVAIGTADELFEIAEKINQGDRQLASAHIVLTADIDLHGVRWTPIGIERSCAFTGVFDGDRHTVKNFIIKGKTRSKGFFGYINGEVYNLSIDCRIKGGSYVGGIAAHNENGIIGCCCAIIDINGGDCIGGLVGLNTGVVFMSYVAGRMTARSILWLYLLALFLLPLFAILFYRVSDQTIPVFAPVPYDKDIKRIPDDLSSDADKNFVSFQFKQLVDVDLATGLCRFDFKNPGNSNHDIVVEIHFTDAQAINIMGSTGRNMSEQLQLANSPGYDSENHRTTIAKSGAIPPGYGLENLQLVQMPNGAVIPPGEYNAIAYLVFYNTITHNLAMVKSQMPITIFVHN